MKIKLVHKQIAKNDKRKTPSASFKTKISLYESQLNTYKNFVKEELEENNRCPVTWEEFNSLNNPPYLIYGCNHRISLSALKKLKVIPVKVGQVIKTTYMHCPLCRNKMPFATLDFSYLKVARLQQIVNNPQSPDSSTSQKLDDNHPHYFTPRRGCLSSLSLMF